MVKTVGLVIAVAAVFSLPQAVHAAAEDYITQPQTIITETRFSEELLEEVSPLPFPTEYEEDPELEYGKEEVGQVGMGGWHTDIYRVTYWKGEEIYRVLDHTEVEEPIPEIIRRGTKIVWRSLETPEVGEIEYWAKLSSWTTSYDGNCAGCRGLTYSGTPVAHGVCATDPAVIPLGTNFYVPGYGICRAEDVGGAIDGTDVDLGFEDVREGWWGARWEDVYLITNAPERR